MAFLFRIAKYTFKQVVVTIGGVDTQVVLKDGSVVLLSN